MRVTHFKTFFPNVNTIGMEQIILFGYKELNMYDIDFFYSTRVLY